MEDVTHFVLRYREAARHVWNCFLREEPDDSPGAHDWEALKQVLFTALVLRNCGHDECAATLLTPDRFGFSWTEPIVQLRVVPTGKAPAMISRDPGGGGYWDHPVESLGPDDADLRFIDFFDFDERGHLDFKYYRVGIKGSTRDPALVGHHALIQVSHARVMAVAPSKAI